MQTIKTVSLGRLSCSLLLLISTSSLGNDTKNIALKKRIYDILVPIVPNQEYHQISRGSSLIPLSVKTKLSSANIGITYMPTARAIRTFSRHEALCFMGATATILKAYAQTPLIQSKPLNTHRWYIATPKNSPKLSRPEQLYGKTVGLPKGVVPKHHIPDSSQINFVFATRLSLIKMLTTPKADRIDAAIIDNDLSEEVMSKITIDKKNPLMEYQRTLSCLANQRRSKQIIETFNHAYSL